MDETVETGVERARKRRERMSADIPDEELVQRMERWAQFEDHEDRLAPFRDVCTAIVRILGDAAPEMLADLPDAVSALVDERRNALREAEVRIGRLEALAFLLYRSFYDGPIDVLSWMSAETKALLADAVRHVSPNFARTRGLPDPEQKEGPQLGDVQWDERDPPDS